MLDNTGKAVQTVIKCRDEISCLNLSLYPEYPLLRGDILDKEKEE